MEQNMTHLKVLGRLIAADFMGMGDSEKLDPALDASRYSFKEGWACSKSKPKV